MVDGEEALDGLTDAQRHAVTHPSPELVVIAGAGSGKTRVITHRIAHRTGRGDINARNVLALTFTRKAAGELTGRLRRLGLRDAVSAGTFHAVAYAQLRSRWAERRIDPPSLLDRRHGFVVRLLDGDPKTTPADVVSEIEWAKARMIPPAQYPAAAGADGRVPPLDPEVVGDIYRRYESEKRRRRMVDFDDLLRLCCHDLHDDREFAAAQHWRYRHLFVDEFQDVNPLQFALLQAWLGTHPDLCAVGDPRQAIYGWNGADAHYLSDFSDYFPRAQRVDLDENHRSSPQILAAANRLAADQSVGQPGRSNRPDAAAPVVTACADDASEAATVATAIRDHHRPGDRWRDQAVLVRTNAQMALFEKSLERAGIPYRVRGGRTLAEQPEIKEALKRIAHSIGPFSGVLSDLEAEASPADDALFRLGREYAVMDPTPSVIGFVAWLRDGGGHDQIDPDADAVDIATFHAAKGLEWRIVHLAGLEEGFAPLAHATTPDALAEEQRLIYVAITRAAETLRCTWARRRRFGNREMTRRPSPYLADIEAPDGAAPSDRIDPRPFIADQRVQLRSVPTSAGRPAQDAERHQAAAPGDREMYQMLRQWRSATARAAEVPVSVVFHDETLAELARRRPTSTDQLLAVSGVGPIKAQRYGDALLRLLLQHQVS